MYQSIPRMPPRRADCGCTQGLAITPIAQYVNFRNFEVKSKSCWERIPQDLPAKPQADDARAIAQQLAKLLKERSGPSHSRVPTEEVSGQALGLGSGRY